MITFDEKVLELVLNFFQIYSLTSESSLWGVKWVIWNWVRDRHDSHALVAAQHSFTTSLMTCNKLQFTAGGLGSFYKTNQPMHTTPAANDVDSSLFQTLHFAYAPNLISGEMRKHFTKSHNVLAWRKWLSRLTFATAVLLLLKRNVIIKSQVEDLNSDFLLIADLISMLD